MGEEGPNPPAATRSRLRLGTVASAVLSLAALAGSAAAADADTLGKTTLEQRIVADGSPGFRALGLGPGEAAHVVRTDGIGVARDGRASRRRELAYFGQLSDFQLADEESPARVEFLDPGGGPFDSAFRPWEALEPHIDDAMIRQLNAFGGGGPVTDAGGARRPMDFSINTGDSADSQQLNETQWVRQLIEGEEINPGSGSDPAGYGPHPLCDTVSPPGADEAARYTGVQDLDDYGATPHRGYFYDPDQPEDGWPRHEHLMDRAQQAFTARGLDAPSYLAFGNHDALVQGSLGADSELETIATGCIKPMLGTLGDAIGVLFTGDPVDQLLARHNAPGEDTMLVPPDPARRLVSKARYKSIFINGAQPDGHGFGLIDPAEEAASRGAAGYYSFSPVNGLRMIALDTVSEGGALGESSNGNLDDPQFRWLEAELQKATRADELVIVFSHHAPSNLTAASPDESAAPCAAVDLDTDPPGCDLDPRDSRPIHLGDEVVSLLHGYPHAIAWIAGHSHRNRVEPFAREGGGGFWGIRVAAEADWPQQARLLQLFDNRDGSLSLFGTIIDHAAPATAPASETAADGLDPSQLASIGRTLAYNDQQSGARGCGASPCGEGQPEDRNVELLIADPRTALKPGRCANPQRGGKRRDRLTGTRAGDDLRGRGGRDRLIGKAGRDCLSGGAGGDTLIGGRAQDLLKGGTGNDRLKARDGKRDVVRCGPGRRDRAVVDRADRVRGCERVKRRR